MSVNTCKEEESEHQQQRRWTDGYSGKNKMSSNHPHPWTVPQIIKFKSSKKILMSPITNCNFATSLCWYPFRVKFHQIGWLPTTSDVPSMEIPSVLIKCICLGIIIFIIKCYYHSIEYGWFTLVAKLILWLWTE